MSQTRAVAKLYEVALDDGSTWRGTKRQLMESHPTWFQYAKEVPRSQTSQPTRQQSAADELYADEDHVTRPPRSAIRYQVDTDGYPIPPGKYSNGDTQLNIKYGQAPASQRHAIPPRRSAQTQQAPAYDVDQEEEEQEPQTRVGRRPKLQIHWLVFVGVALLLMIGGWIAFNDLGAWWQNHTDDVTYGMPRTFQTDAVVGHGDSNSNPSHFIAINLRGSIYIIEAPGGDISKARQYFITNEVNGNPYPPVTVKFEDLTHSGHLDMVVSIGDPPTPLIVFLFNDGSQFLAKSK